MNLNKLRKETIKELEDLKNNLTRDEEENCCNMVNIMIDYDNEAQDFLGLYDNCQENYNFVDDETVKYLIEDCDNSIDRLRCFINDTRSASIYRLNGYGNLENIDNNDLEFCIDDAIDILKNAIKESEED